jgi:hypothetical protein
MCSEKHHLCKLTLSSPFKSVQYSKYPGVGVPDALACGVVCGERLCRMLDRRMYQVGQVVPSLVDKVPPATPTFNLLWWYLPNRTHPKPAAHSQLTTLPNFLLFPRKNLRTSAERKLSTPNQPSQLIKGASRCISIELVCIFHGFISLAE